ncbi:MAG TPA: aminoglycoside 6-adenylyltransferase [Actinomycetota bacterium]|jgi:aminoglycoside 6-adenylyltransferase|nr:aminoglycoside 6-adenylyltransferase [Actinomycetota bacterium]
MEHRLALDRVYRWAHEDDNIRLVVLTGSLARGEGAADDLSDLDIELYVRDPSLLLERSDWYRPFGEVLVVEEPENVDWHPTRLVHYVDGKIDFMIAGIDAAIQGVSYDRPFHVLLDKDGLSHGLSRAAGPPLPPSRDEITRCINWFYAAALMSAKCLIRGEPWMAKFRDRDVKDELLQMLVWDHRSRYGWTYDTWHNGGHLREWIDHDLMDAVGSCWGDFSIVGMGRALRASVSLFEELSARTQAALGVQPFDSGPVRAEIDRLLSLPHRTA